MNKRENLTAKRTVDKNGKATTVYVKQSAAASPASRIPAPAPHIEPKSTKERATAISDIADVWMPAGSIPTQRSKLIDNLNEYSDEMLERLTANIPNDPRQWLCSGVMDQRSEIELREQMEFLPVLSEATYFIASNMIRSLHGYPDHLVAEDFSTADEKVKEQCRSLLLVSFVLNDTAYYEPFKDESPRFVLKDDELAEFIINHSDKAERMAAFVRERSGPDITFVDLELLADAIGSESAALSTGVL